MKLLYIILITLLTCAPAYATSPVIFEDEDEWTISLNKELWIQTRSRLELKQTDLSIRQYNIKQATLSSTLNIYIITFNSVGYITLRDTKKTHTLTITSESLEDSMWKQTQLTIIEQMQKAVITCDNTTRTQRQEIKDCALKLNNEQATTTELTQAIEEQVLPDSFCEITPYMEQAIATEVRYSIHKNFTSGVPFIVRYANYILLVIIMIIVPLYIKHYNRTHDRKIIWPE